MSRQLLLLYKAVQEFVERLNLSNIRYDADDCAYEEEVGLMTTKLEEDGKHELEIIEHYTGPCIEELDRLVAIGKQSECPALHKRCREAFELDGGADIICRHIETEREIIIPISWHSTKGVTVPHITRWEIRT
jgi:hypothetical protein